MSLLGIVLANLIPQSWGLGFAGVLSLVGHRLLDGDDARCACWPR